MNKTILKRIAEVEKKLDAQATVPEWQRRSEQTRPILEMMDVLRRKNEMEEVSMTLEERIAKHQRGYQEDEAYIKEHHSEWKMWYEMTPQEKETADTESAKAAEEARKWLASDERKQFEKEYAEFSKKQEGIADDHLG